MKLHLLGTVLALAMVATAPADIRYSIRAATQEERVFELGPDVKRTGTLETGAPVTVRFYLENGKRVVTEVTGKSAK